MPKGFKPTAQNPGKYRSRAMRKRTLPRSVVKANRQLATIKMVKRIIARGRENKMVSHLVENGVAHNSTITNADYYPLIPAVTVGAGDNQRIGDKINAKGLYFHVNVSLYSSYAYSTNQPIRVRMFVLSHKSIKQSQMLASSLPPFNVMLRSNDDGTAGSTLSAYDGTPQTHILPVNKDIYTVHKDISFPLAPATESATIVYNGSPLYQANRQFKLKIPCPKVLNFDRQSTGVDTPINFAPFVAIGYAYPDNSAVPDTGIVTKVVVTSRSFLYYEDA